VLALSKADLVDPAVQEAARAQWSKRVGSEVPVVVTSSVARTGLDQLAAELVRRIPLERGDLERPEAAPATDHGGRHRAPPDGLAEHRVFRPAARRAYHVERVGAGRYKVSGEGVERLVARYDLENEDALAYLERRLRGIGVIEALASEGFEPGDEVEIGGVAFDLDPEV
jgi:GTPase